MKKLASAILLSTLTLGTAMADGPISLKASTGENIRVWYATKYYTNGNTASSNTEGVHVTVDHATPGVTRVVLINNCVPSNEWTSRPTQTIFNCEYGNDGTWVNQQNCSDQGVQVEGAPINANVITTWWANHGGQTNCYQQIAVSLNYNNWLVDPISGLHNFNFRFPIAR